MPLRDQLLTPIPGSNPGGVALRYEPVFDKIKEARREDDDMPQGDWQTERKTADWQLVIKLSTDAIATKSKDLQVAAWLTEAKLKKEGVAGLKDSLDLLDGMIESFWDHLYPEIDDGDAEMRAAPLEWVGKKLTVPVKDIAVTRNGIASAKYKESRLIPTEVDAAADESKANSRNNAIESGKLVPEEFDRAFDATPKPWYKTLVADLDGSLEVLTRLDTRSKEKFGNAAPTFIPLREAIEDVRRGANTLLKRKLELDPDPVDVTSAAAGVSGATEEGATARSMSISVEPTSKEDAASRISAAARFLRQNDPFNPASFLLLRGFRWGELRARRQDANGASAAAGVDLKLLEAPTTQTRTQLKSLLIDARWKDLLEAGETVMAMPQGRGWIDLQRYVLTACNELGSDYDAVGSAIRSELRSLLNELPQLLEVTMMDDTPTANAETRTWLRTSVLTNGKSGSMHAVAVSAGDEAGVEAAQSGEEYSDSGPRREPLALAMAEVRGGRPDRAIALLMREASREKTKRGRFLTQAQLAAIMVEAGHQAVAMPILEELLAAIEMHKLEDWEAGEIVAQPMALLYRCLGKLDGDPAMRQNLYLRICRLDPLQAMSFAQS
jgi:type VI secretion system protein ImpA